MMKREIKRQLSGAFVFEKDIENKERLHAKLLTLTPQQNKFLTPNLKSFVGNLEQNMKGYDPTKNVQTGQS